MKISFNMTSMQNKAIFITQHENGKHATNSLRTSVSENAPQGKTHQVQNSHDDKQTVGNHDLKYALCSTKVLKGGCASTSFSTPRLTASIKACGFADFLVRHSARHHCARMYERSATDPEHASFLNICIIRIVSCCSATCVVLAVVTKLFASVLM